MQDSKFDGKSCNWLGPVQLAYTMLSGDTWGGKGLEESNQNDLFGGQCSYMEMHSI